MKKTTETRDPALRQKLIVRQRQRLRLIAAGAFSLTVLAFITAYVLRSGDTHAGDAHVLPAETLPVGMIVSQVRQDTSAVEPGKAAFKTVRTVETR